MFERVQHKSNPVGAIYNYVPVRALQFWTPWSAPTETSISVHKNGYCRNWPSNVTQYNGPTTTTAP